MPFLHQAMVRRGLSHLSAGRGEQVETIEAVGLNGLPLSQFRRIIEESPLEIVRWRENVGDHPAYRLFRLAANVPFLRNTFTSNVYAVLRRRDELSLARWASPQPV